MGINFVCSLPALSMAVFALLYAIKSIINILKNKTRITTLDNIIFILFIIGLVEWLINTMVG